MSESTSKTDWAFSILDAFKIEIPSWGFANTGTRFGKFLQPAAAATIEEKFHDAAEVNRLTGASETLALHVLWDLPKGLADAENVLALSKETGIKPGSINPNFFQDQQYKFGSLCNPSRDVRRHAIQHLLNSIEIAAELDSRDISLWVSDGSNYPGTQSIRHRIGWLEEAMAEGHAALAEGQRMLVEYKPFEPAFYHSDLGDWGMALHIAQKAGPQAKVLVDTGHHYQGQNIEQIVAWLLHTGMLGGFHFNDRRYADDDLTLGSIDPYQIFRIFHEIHAASYEGLALDVAFMIDQSHNLKGKIEAMVQTVVTAQELWLKAASVDLDELTSLQQSCDLVGAEELYRRAFWLDVSPLLKAWREARGLPVDPIATLRSGEYLKKITKERGGRNPAGGGSYA